MDKLEPVERVGETSADFGARIGKKEWPSPVPAEEPLGVCSLDSEPHPQHVNTLPPAEACVNWQPMSTPLPVDQPAKHRTWTEVKAEMDSVDLPEKLKAICPHCGKSFESWLAQRSPVGTPIQAGDVGASLNVKAPTPNSVDLEEKLTINDAARLIKKLEACSGMPAKLLILKHVAALGRAEGLAEAAKVCAEFTERLHIYAKQLAEAIRALKEKP